MPHTAMPHAVKTNAAPQGTWPDTPSEAGALCRSRRLSFGLTALAAVALAVGLTSFVPVSHAQDWSGRYLGEMSVSLASLAANSAERSDHKPHAVTFELQPLAPGGRAGRHAQGRAEGQAEGQASLFLAPEKVTAARGYLRFGGPDLLDRAAEAVTGFAQPVVPSQYGLHHSSNVPEAGGLRPRIGLGLEIDLGDGHRLIGEVYEHDLRNASGTRQRSHAIALRAAFAF